MASLKFIWVWREDSYQKETNNKIEGKYTKEFSVKMRHCTFLLRPLEHLQLSETAQIQQHKSASVVEDIFWRTSKKAMAILWGQ